MLDDSRHGRWKLFIRWADAQPAGWRKRVAHKCCVTRALVSYWYHGQRGVPYWALRTLGIVRPTRRFTCRKMER